MLCSQGIFQFKDVSTLFFYQKERNGTGIIVFGLMSISHVLNQSSEKKPSQKVCLLL